MLINEHSPLGKAIMDCLYDNGYNSFGAYAREADFGNGHHIGMCRGCHAEYEEPVEPDARGITCPECGNDSVESLYVLGGVL